jgi:hypothetical protein
VYLDLLQDTSHPESQVHRDPLVEELVEELKDRVAFLERTLVRRSPSAILVASTSFQVGTLSILDDNRVRASLRGAPALSHSANLTKHGMVIPCPKTA